MSENSPASDRWPAIAFHPDDAGAVGRTAHRYELAVTSGEASDSLFPPEPWQDEATDRYPIDLPTALRLAGANNLQIALAAERVREAVAREQLAEAAWIPSFRLGVGYNRHDGQLQATRGPILEISRSSLFFGGGAGLGGAPLAGGASGPIRFMVNLSLADVWFNRLAARQSTRAAQAAESAAFNDTLLEVSLAYWDLVRARMDVAIAHEAVEHTKELVHLAESFVRSGAGLEADASRARAELASRRRDLAAAEETLRVRSAELGRLLRLDPAVLLVPVDPHPLPVSIVPEDASLDALIAQGLASRPELTQWEAILGQTSAQWRREKWRPWLPILFVGASAGGFGGGPNSFFGDFGGRSDFDVLAIWELENLGIGNRARADAQASLHRQAHLEYERTRDRISAEIAAAWHQVQLRRRQIEQARRQVQQAAAALPLNFEGIRGGQLRPIEAQQAIAALAQARRRYLQAVIDHNQAQFRLLRAIGRAPGSAAEPSSGTRPLEPPPAPPAS